MAHTGSFSSAAAQKKPLIMTVKGVRVAFLAYTELTNGIPLPHPWSVNRASAARILSDAHRARRDGAQVVIVNLHWGDEDVAQPSSFQLALASKLTRSPDITAIVGQHVHIVQPIRILGGKLVVFGEGNLISNQTSACCPAAMGTAPRLCSPRPGRWSSRCPATGIPALSRRSSPNGSGG